MTLKLVTLILTATGQLEKALEYQGLSYGNAMESGNKESALRSAAYTLLAADRLGRKEEAEKWRQTCVGLLPEVEATMARLVYYQVECSINLKGGNQREAIGYFKKILALDGIDSMPFVRFDCYNNMHISYAGMGDYQHAYEILLKANELRDSLYEQEQAENLRDLTVKYETKETELALAQSEAMRARTLAWLIGAVAALIGIVAGFLLYATRQRRRRMEREMEFANLRADVGRQLTRQYIDGLESERQRMSRELHDGVCNDLLAIEMKLNNGSGMESAGKLIESCRESVRRISHELMPPEFAYATIDEVVRYYIAKQNDANAGRIQIACTSVNDGGDWGDVSDAVALELYRIVQEAVGNAVKHSGADHIGVAMSMAGPEITIAITDNGNFQAASRRGLGLESMRRRASAVNASLSIADLENGGTKVVISLKI